MILDFFSFPGTITARFETRAEADAVNVVPYKLAIFAHRRGFDKICFAVGNEKLIEFSVSTILKMGRIDVTKIPTALTLKGAKEFDIIKPIVRIVDFSRQA